MKHASYIAALVVGCAVAKADFCPNYPFGPGLFLDIWAATCNSPGTGVYLSSVNNGIESVSFSGGNIDIIAQPGNSGEPALIQVQAFQSGTSIGNITVFSADAVDVSIVFSPSIRNVGSVRIHPAPGNVVRRLSLAGQIAGDMGEVEATGIANLGAVLSLEIQGDLTGHVTLFDNGLSDELRIRSLTVNGNIAPNLTIDAESGGIGTIEVGGVVGAQSNPVLIRSGRDITSITAGAMYANIQAKCDDPNDPNAPTVYANIHELRTLFDTGSGPAHSGIFDGSILANSIGQPIERGFEIGTPGISQIEIQGDLAAVLTFHAPVVPDQTFDGPQIVVGGDFLSTSIIQLPENGLVGQIILNRDDEDGIWQTTPPNGAKVIVGDPSGPGPAYSLTGPSYGFTASSLGGGAAGHAAFRVHRQSSVPPLSQFFPVDHFAFGELRLEQGGLGWECVFDSPIIVQFYGPVGINNPEVPAMKIERREGLIWVDKSSGFEFEPSFDGDAKRLLVRPLGDWEAGSYRIQREPGRLHCQDVAFGTTDVARFLFYIDVTLVPCDNELLMGFDLNADEAVTTPGDLPVLLVQQVDLSGDSVTDTADVSLLQSAAALYAQPAPYATYYQGPWDDIELP